MCLIILFLAIISIPASLYLLIAGNSDEKIFGLLLLIIDIVVLKVYSWLIKDNKKKVSKQQEVINTTPVGMYPNVDASPVEDEVVFKSKVVIDIIFNPIKTKLLSKAKIGINGMEMLLMQAIKAEEIWQQRKIAVDLDKLLVIEGEVDE